MDDVWARIEFAEKQIQAISEKCKLTGPFMDEIKTKLERIEQQGVESKIASKVLETTFAAHEVQNTKDFKHVDDCIHRADNESRTRDEELAAVLGEIRTQFQEVQKLVWKASGALLIVVPVINYFVDKL